MLRGIFMPLTFQALFSARPLSGLFALRLFIRQQPYTEAQKSAQGVEHGGRAVGAALAPSARRADKTGCLICSHIPMSLFPLPDHPSTAVDQHGMREKNQNEAS